MRREVADIQQQHVQLAAGLQSAVAAAAAAPASPQKALAAQVLSGLQCSMQSEVGKELQALQLADQLLESVRSQFRSGGSPPRDGGGGSGRASPEGSAAATAEAQAAAGAGKADVAAGAAAVDTPGWTIAAVPAPASSAAEHRQVAYPAAPSSKQALASAADGALAQLQQLAGGQAQLAQAAAALAASSGASGAASGGSSSSLRQTFGQMQHMLQSVCALLQPQEEAEGQRRRPSPEAAYQAAASRYLSRSSSLAQARSSSPCSAQPRPAWGTGGRAKLAGGAAAAGTVGAAASRSLSFGGAGGGGAAREAARESVLGQAALEQRRRRLQALYSELRTAGQ